MVQLQLGGLHFQKSQAAKKCDTGNLTHVSHHHKTFQIHRFEPTSAEHGLNLGLPWANLVHPLGAQLGSNMGPTPRNLDPTSTCLGTTSAQLAPHVDSTWGSGRSNANFKKYCHMFSFVFATLLGLRRRFVQAMFAMLGLRWAKPQAAPRWTQVGPRSACVRLNLPPAKVGLGRA